MTVVDPQQRKARSIEVLQKLNIPVLETLPVIESSAETQLRAPSEVARRILCLMLVSDVARNADPNDCLVYLRKNSLFEYLSPAERRHP